MNRIRKYWFSKYYTVVDFWGTEMLMPVFSDLTDLQVRAQYNYYLEREDYEYLEHVVGELKLRGIELSKKHHK